MATKYLKPMLDAGSPRVFNCNEMTRRIQAKDPAAGTFFRTKTLNAVVLIKDTVPAFERRGGGRSTGTKLYFPFNADDIYEGGRSIFVHDKHLRQAIAERLGQGALANEALAEDLRILAILDRLPSLDPFLMKDVFLREGIAINEAYFDVSPEAYRRIEAFILQRFEPLVHAAFPDAMSSDDKARRLIEKVWEGRDLVELRPLVEAFRLPEDKSLEIFAAWKGINFYAFQYECVKPRLIELSKWLKEASVPVGPIPVAERNDFHATLDALKAELRREWQTFDAILRTYQESYDKAFRLKESSAPFLAFLRDSDKAYWDLGHGLGKAGHAIYCWDVMAGRFVGRKLPWDSLRETIGLLAAILQPERVAATSVAWT